MIRFAIGVIALLAVAAPALAAEAAWNDLRTPLDEPQGRGLHADDPVRMAGAYIGPTLSPLCTGRGGSPCWLETENQPGCHVWTYKTLPDGAVTETITWSGACVEGKASGQGRLVWRGSYGQSIYIGAMQAGELHGRGTATWANHNRYEGEWRDGRFHGRGTYNWAKGSGYEGEWRDGEPHGYGTYTTADGKIYRGQWRNGCFGKRGGSWATIFTTAAACGFE